MNFLSLFSNDSWFGTTEERRTSISRRRKDKQIIHDAMLERAELIREIKSLKHEFGLYGKMVGTIDMFVMSLQSLHESIEWIIGNSKVADENLIQLKTLELAKIDHYMYKINVYKLFARMHPNFVQVQVSSYPSQGDCNLGKWISDEHCKKSKISNLKEFQELEHAHIEFHIYGEAAVHYLNSGLFQEGMEQLRSMELASIKVSGSLKQLSFLVRTNSLTEVPLLD